MLIPAMPAAPASAQAAIRSAVMPPNAATGKELAKQASRSPPRPGISLWPGLDRVGNTGPKTARSAPSRSARQTSSTVCVDTAIRKPDGTTGLRSQGAGEPAGRWTPCAPAASATSKRLLTKIGVRWGRTRAKAARARSSRSRGGRSFSRSWIQEQPRLAFLSMQSSKLPGQVLRSVM